MTLLQAEPLTAESFSPFGRVIEFDEQYRQDMNAARFARAHALADVDVDGTPIISLVRCQVASTLPYVIEFVERHPRGSQAFVPLANFQFLVVVGVADETVDTSALRAFVSNGHQGIQYHRGVWHMPLIGLATEQAFLVVDSAIEPNCDEYYLPDPIRVTASLDGQ